VVGAGTTQGPIDGDGGDAAPDGHAEVSRSSGGANPRRVRMEGRRRRSFRGRETIPRFGDDIRNTKIAVAGPCLLVGAAVRPASAGIFNGTYNRNDGYFLPNFFPGSNPRTTIMRGFCYSFVLNGDLIDLTEKVSASDPDITGLTKTKTLNGFQNSV